MTVKKKIFLILLGISLLILLAPVVFSLLLRLPAVQNFIVHKTIDIANQRIRGHISLSRIDVRMPGTIILENLFVRDALNDTVAVASVARVRLELLKLPRRIVHIKSLRLSGCRVTLRRKDGDRKLNIEHLFSVKNAPEPARSGKKRGGGEKLSLDVKRVHCRNTQFLFDDLQAGVRVEARAGRLDIKMDRFRLDSLRFDVSWLTLDSSYCAVRLFRKLPRGKPIDAVRLPRITAKTLGVTNTSFFFEDTVAGNTIRAEAGRIDAEKCDVAVNAETVSAGSLFVLGGAADLALTVIAKPKGDGTTAPASKPKKEHRWKIFAGGLDLRDSRFDFDILNKPALPGGFDPAHMHFRNISVQATDAFYSSGAIRGHLLQAAVENPTAFEVKKAAADFCMDARGISAQNLCIQTTSSYIRASCQTGYSPLHYSLDSLPKLPITAAVQPSTVSTGEIRVFAPALAAMPLFDGNDKIIRFSGKIGGSLQSLKGENICASYGSATNLRTDFSIDGLPSIKNAVFDISALTLHTGKDDVESMAGRGAASRGLSIPSRVRLDAAFKGTLRAFRSTVRAAGDNGSVSAQVTLDAAGRYTGAISVSDLNAGQLYRKAKAVGATTFSATVNGRGFDPKTLSAHVKIDAPSLRFNGYPYRNVKFDATAEGQRYRGALSIQDENVSLALQGDARTEKGFEQIRCEMDLRGADFAKLKLLKDSLRVSARLKADLKGKSLNTMSGRAGMTDIAIVKDGTDYRLDSLTCEIATTPQRQTLSVQGGFLDAWYDGAMPVKRALEELSEKILGNLPLQRNAPDTARRAGLNDFSLTVKVYDHPLLSGLLPGLTACEEGAIRAGYSGERKTLTAEAAVRNGEYNGFAISGARAVVETNGDGLAYSATVANITNAKLHVDTVRLWGASRKNRAAITMSAVGKKKEPDFFASVSLKTSDSGTVLVLDPGRFYLGGHPWTVSGNNYTLIKGNSVAIHDLVVSGSHGGISVASAAGAARDAISVAVRDFDLRSFSRMLYKDSSSLGGMLNARIDIYREGERSAVKAQAGFRDIVVQNVKIGSLTLGAENPGKGKYLITAELAGEGNDARVEGAVTLGPAKRSLDIRAAVKSLTLRTLEPFTSGAVSESRGYLQGTFMYSDAHAKPVMNGTLLFREASVKPAALNSTIRFGNEAVEIKNSGLYFNGFSVRDRHDHTAKVFGAVTMHSAGRFRFDLKANAENFLLLNTSERDNPVAHGRLIVDFRAAIRGTPDFPVVESHITLKAPSHLTFSAPGSGANLDKGESVVVFSSSAKRSAANKSAAAGRKHKTAFRGIELTSEIEAGRGVTLRLIPDPSTRDSIVVRGDAALNLGLERSGKISLTGTYRLSEGGYTVRLPPLVVRNFTIRSGSTLVWNGDPMDITADIGAKYAVSAAPIDLISGQISAMKDKNGYKTYRRPLQFEVALNLKGPVSKPDISFSLDLAPSEKGDFGMIDEKLRQINQDPTALNKQVFALLLFGKFLPDDIFDQSGGNDQLTSVARTSVSGLLTAQLNQWGASMLPGVQFNVGVQSYDDDTSGLAVGKTMVDFGVRKQLFNDRLSVEVGGVFDVEGKKENQSAMRDIGGNVAVEYRITQDGRYSIKGFRHTHYEGALDGSITETGAGIVYSRDFHFWRQLFRWFGKGKNER